MNEPQEQNETPPENGGEAQETAQENVTDMVTALQTQLAQQKDQMLRALAEAENGRKRALKDREEAGKYAVASFAKEMLNVADNLRRALDSVPGDLHDDPRLTGLVEGVEATQREMLKIFERQGIRIINPMDEPFNPNYHEVMFEAPSMGKRAGTVMQVIEVGYILHDRLLRPARVGVAKDDGHGGPAPDPGTRIDTSA